MRIFRALVFSNLWISLGAFFCGLQSIIIIKNEVSFFVPLILFFSTFFIYNFQRLIRRIRGEYPRSVSLRLDWMEAKIKGLNVLTLLSLIVLITLLLNASLNVWILLSVLGFLSVGYVIPVVSSKGSLVGFRDVPGLKIFLIALTWSGATVLLPVLTQGSFSDILLNGVPLLFVEKFIFILAITIPFDIRDLVYDEPQKSTIPQLIGVSKAMRLSKGLIILAMSLNVLLCFLGFITPINLIAMELSYVLIFYVLTFTGQYRSELYFGGLLDGTIILQFISVFIFWYFFS